MNTLLIKQPISELILEMRRSIEDRNLNFNFHSEFLLHSSNNIMKEMVDTKNQLCNLGHDGWLQHGQSRARFVDAGDAGHLAGCADGRRRGAF